MSNPYECPNCGAEWQFCSGECNADDGQLEPDEGHCDKCGFSYSQHVRYPLKEQLAAFRQKRPKREFDPRTGKVIRKKPCPFLPYAQPLTGISISIHVKDVINPFNTLTCPTPPKNPAFPSSSSTNSAWSVYGCPYQQAREGLALSPEGRRVIRLTSKYIKKILGRVTGKNRRAPQAEKKGRTR